MSKPLFVDEDKQWSRDPAENAQYRRIARAWNAIHLYLIRRPDLLCTNVINHSLAFFRYKGELLMASEFSAAKMSADCCLSLNDFEGQAEGDLADLADAMERWIGSPGGIKRAPKQRSFADLLLDKLDDTILAKYRPWYLTVEIQPSIAGLVSDGVEAGCAGFSS